MAASKTSAQLIAIILLTGLVTAIIVGEGVYAWQKNRQNSLKQDFQNQLNSLKQQAASVSPESVVISSPADSSTPLPSNKPVVGLTKNLQTYTDPQLGITFKYPSTVSVLGAESKSIPSQDGIRLVVGTQRLTGPQTQGAGGFSPDMVAKDKAALQKGDPSTPLVEAVPASYKALTVPGALAKEYLVLRASDPCNVQFSDQALIYKDDSIIILTAIPNNQKIIEANSAYFTTDKANCGSQPVWKDEKVFYRDLEAGKTDPASQEWSKVLDEVVGTFQFTHPVSTPTPTP